MEAERVRTADLKDALHRNCAPNILVLPTSPAEAIARKNELSFIDLLRPFAQVDTSGVAINTTREQPYRVPRMTLHFCESGEVLQPPEEFVDVVLDGVVRASAPMASKMVSDIDGKLVAATVIEEKGEGELAPWFGEYRSELLRGLGWTDHEYFDHPVAVLLIAATSEPDIVNKLMALLSLDALPPLFREGLLDPNMLKHYVLLHDNTEDAAAAEQAEATLRSIRETLGAAQCSLIRINSQPVPAGGTPPATPEDIWTPCRPHAAKMDLSPDEKDRVRGALLSRADIDGVRLFVKDFTLKALVPHLDKRVRLLNQQVTAVRKGVKNQLKSWGTSLFGKAALSGADTAREGYIEGTDATGPTYLYNSIEGQIRALADISFALHDYDAALSNYRLVLSDYKRDKALRHVAAASEMSAVCLFLQGVEPKKQDDFFDAAYSNYLKHNLLRYAVRTTLLHADVLRARGRASEAAEKLLRVTISDPNDLRSALLYEQAALSFLLVKNGGAHVRKYALHLVHAGHRFLKAGHKAHGLRCYLSALRVYQDKRWTHVDDHLYSALAKHSISTQMISEAVSFYVKLLANQKRKPMERQQIYLRDFITVMRQHCPERVISDLSLPSICDSSLRIIIDEPSVELSSPSKRVAMDDGVTLQASVGGSVESMGMGAVGKAANDAPLHKEGPFGWSDLEEALLDPRRWRERLRQGRSSLQNLRGALPDPVPRNGRCVVVGEDTLWQVTLTNPLQVPLELQGLTLSYSFSASEEGADKAAVIGGVDSEQPWEDGREETTAAEGVGPLVVEKFDLTLEGGARKSVTIKMRAVKEGWVCVTGLRWKLGGAVKCVHHFAGALGGEDADKKSGSKVHPSRDARFRMRAVPPMPRLQVRIQGLPAQALYGEVMRCLIEVTNVGAKPAASLRLAASHPAFFGPAAPAGQGSGDLDYPRDCFEDAGAQGLATLMRAWHDTAYDPDAELDPSVIELPLGEDGKGLPAAGVVRIPVWCRASRPGVHLFRLLFAYTPQPGSGAAMAYRLCQVEETLHVLPSLRTAAHLRTSAADMNKLTLAVHLDHAAPHSAALATGGGDRDEIDVVQLSLLSQKWLVAPSAIGSTVCPARLRAGSKAVIHTQIGPVSEAEGPGEAAREAANTWCDQAHASCVSCLVLSAEDDTSSEARQVLPLPSSPLAQFLRGWEKRLQGAAYWHEQAAADASAGLDIGAGKSSKKLLAEERRAKLEAWQKQTGGSADAGTRVVIVWTSKDGSRMGAVFLRAGEPDTPSRPDLDANVQHVGQAHEGASGKDTMHGKPAKPGGSAGGEGAQLVKLASHLSSHLDRAQTCPLQVRLLGPTTVKARAALGVTVPVSVALANSHWTAPLTVVFEALSPASAQGSAAASGGVESGFDFEWGGVQRKSLAIAPRSEARINLTVTVMCAGIYNLNRFRVSFPSTASDEGAGVGAGGAAALFPPLDFSLNSSFQRLLRVVS